MFRFSIILIEREEYYKKRANKYEEIYHRDDKIRLEEQQKIANALKDTLKGRKVLEVACGTGYWTHPIRNSSNYNCNRSWFRSIGNREEEIVWH